MIKPVYEYPGLFDDIGAELVKCERKNHTYIDGAMNCPYCECIFQLQWAYQKFQRGNDMLKEFMEKADFIEKERKKVGRVTKRYSPTGYVAVSKPLARKLYEQGKEVTFCGNNVNSFHVFDGWRLEYTIQKDEENKTDCYDVPVDFQDIVNCFLSHLENELGRYAVFYVKKSDLNEDN